MQGGAVDESKDAIMAIPFVFTIAQRRMQPINPLTRRERKERHSWGGRRERWRPWRDPAWRRSALTGKPCQVSP